jgi:hypothetical protein
MSQPYNIVQTVFQLSLAANGASSISATQTELQGFLNAYLNGGTDPLGTQFAGFFPQMNPSLAGGDWKVVWGPCVYSRKPSTPSQATNAMYVAYSASQATYVVAIAATNPDSIYDWVVEDGDVSVFYQARWPFPVPFTAKWHLPETAAATSAGTAVGISDLLSQPAMVDPNGGTLKDFLSRAASKDATLIFAGHSLAGALSPTMAFYLYPNPASSGWKQVLVLPTAGASPGNTAFAAAFSAAYPATPSGVNAPYGTWNVDYANANDVVPHAWNQLDNIVQSEDSKGNYPSIYGVLDHRLGVELRAALDGARLLAAGGHYMNLPQTVFTPDWGTWKWTQNPDGSWQYPPVWQEMTPFTDANPASASNLGGLILATHINQYYWFFNVIPAPRMPTHLPSQETAAARKKAILAAARLHG